jgi:hypothetical protein
MPTVSSVSRAAARPSYRDNPPRRYCRPFSRHAVVHRWSPGISLGSLDLNLLIVFATLMRERTVRRAGKRLGRSQPATSHALANATLVEVSGIASLTPTIWAQEFKILRGSRTRRFDRCCAQNFSDLFSKTQRHCRYGHLTSNTTGPRIGVPTIGLLGESLAMNAILLVAMLSLIIPASARLWGERYQAGLSPIRRERCHRGHPLR